MNYCKNKHGVITVMISLMLAGILSLGTIVIEAGRLQGARTQLDDANLSAGTSMIASYNSALFERFGLLAIDNEMFSVGRYRDYLNFNSDRVTGYKGDNISTFYTIKTAELEGFYNLTYPSVLKRQLISRAKYNIIPQDYSFNYYNMDYFIADYQTKANYISSILKPVATGTAEQGELNDVPSNMQSSLKNMHTVFSKIKKYDNNYNVTLKSSDISLLPTSTGTVAHSVHSEDFDEINNSLKDANTVLGAYGNYLISNNGDVYKEINVSFGTSFASNVIADIADLKQLPTKAVKITSDCRNMIQGLNASLNMLSVDKEGNLLLNSYIAGYFPNKNNSIDGYSGFPKGKAISGVDNANFSGACIEYVFSGNKSEIVNQQNAYDYIVATRLVNNLYSTITNSSSFDSNNACSVAAHIAWAYYETCVDVELLFKYNAVVPLNKSNMILPINNIELVDNSFASKDFMKAMTSLGVYKNETFKVDGYDKTNYRDALAFALWFVPNTEKLLRVADLVQLEMRYIEHHVQYQSASFLLSKQNTFCRVKCIGSLNSILPVISLSTNKDVNGTSIQSVKYLGY